jgi:acyl-CoA hydrolase
MQWLDTREAWKLVEKSKIFVASMAAAEPVSFWETLSMPEAGGEGRLFYGANPTRGYSCFSTTPSQPSFEIRLFFMTSAVRPFHGRGFVHYVPQHLSQWTDHLFKRHSVDVFWGTCSPPDARGFVSLGVGACYESEVAQRAKQVILEVNDQMPVTFGSTLFPVNRVTGFISRSHSLFEIPQSKPSPEESLIATHIAELVPHGATLQLGIGGLPNALAFALKDHRHLGVHTELINDAILSLTEAGAIDGSQKTLWPGKIVGSFVLGSQKLYQFVNKNPAVELYPSSIINDPYRIGRNHKMVSINTAVEVDFTGQVCSESVGHQELSGVGGAAETHLGAQRSSGGRGIIAMSSRATKNKAPKIVAELKPGAKVSVSRNDVDTIVTEYGIAELSGRTVAERIRALVAIAHPDDREGLLSIARREKYL